ncbi:trypsin-like cysteine/serine peptidase domain-containing protein [Coemansia mojavensis]|nr:trypsin-like cysteine/serine peptidase domain-containing protein [Coemansia mojavensis]
MLFLRILGIAVATIGVFGEAMSTQPKVRLQHFKRVVGGQEATDNEFPFAVYISNPVSTNNTACAGAILTNQIIVSAAYCVYDPSTGKAIDTSKVTVGYGKSNNADQPVTSVEKIIIKDTYDPQSGIDDIALIQVNLTRQSSAAVDRIPVYVGSIEKDDSLSFMGWGSTKEIGFATTNTLNYVNVTVGDEFSCKGVDIYQNSNGRAICTRNILTPGKAPCMGDYGGPLIKYDHGVPKLVGVFSTFATDDGSPLYYCGSNNTRAYYTHINYYMEFLQSKTGLTANDFTGNQPLLPSDGSNTAGNSSAGLSKGAIAGICVAGAAVLILLGVLAYVIRSNTKKRREARHEQRIYELGLQQLADELGGSYEPKVSSAVSAFHSSGVTPLEDNSFISRASMAYRHIRYSDYSDNSDQPFSENIPQINEVGTELTMDTLSKTYRHTDGSPKVMDYIRAERDGKLSDYYRHLLFYAADEEDSGDLIRL